MKKTIMILFIAVLPVSLSFAQTRSGSGTPGLLKWGFTSTLRTGYSPDLPNALSLLAACRLGVGIDVYLPMIAGTGPGVAAEVSIFPIPEMLKAVFPMNFEFKGFWAIPLRNLELRLFGGYQAAFVLGSSSYQNLSNNLGLVGVELGFNSFFLDYTYVFGADSLDPMPSSKQAFGGTGTSLRLGIGFRLGK